MNDSELKVDHSSSSSLSESLNNSSAKSGNGNRKIAATPDN